MENIKTLIQENKDCKMEKGVLCAQHCRDCRYDIECFADDSVHNLCGSFVYLL